MNSFQRSFAVAGAFLSLGILACDQSKAELDQTKAQLQAVTAERDALKTQVGALQGQVTTLTKQLSDANASLAAAQAPKPAAEASHTVSHHSARPTGSSSTAGTETSKPPEPTPQQVEQKAAEQKMTGRSSMNN